MKISGRNREGYSQFSTPVTYSTPSQGNFMFTSHISLGLAITRPKQSNFNKKTAHLQRLTLRRHESRIFRSSTAARSHGGVKLSWNNPPPTTPPNSFPLPLYHLVIINLTFAPSPAIWNASHLSLLYQPCLNRICQKCVCSFITPQILHFYSVPTALIPQKF